MKKIGIVGGLAWRSTMDYYSEICRRSEELHFAANTQGCPLTPEISIESLDLNKAVSCMGEADNEESWSQFDVYHRKALERLQASGAELALIASNTAHHRFKAIVQGIQIPVISIFETAAREAAQIRVRNVLILGTALTMDSPEFRREFAKWGIEATGPNEEVARSRTIKLITELQRGKFKGASNRLRTIARSAIAHQFQGPAAVCLACTELPLAFPGFKPLSVFDYGGTSFINTSAAHINAVFDLAIATIKSGIPTLPVSRQAMRAD
jgi:aspartate racemase